jgi:hypothetical protein
VSYAGVYLLSDKYQSFTIISSLNRSTAVSEKISFKVGKKAVAASQALPIKCLLGFCSAKP